MIDTTVGIESIIWYQRDQADRRRIQITFQDELRKNFIGGEKLPGEIELYGDSSEAPIGRMSVDSPERLDQLAKAIEIAAQHWRHCIQECDCFKVSGTSEAHRAAGEILGSAISFSDFKIPPYDGDGDEFEDQEESE